MIKAAALWALAGWQDRKEGHPLASAQSQAPRADWLPTRAPRPLLTTSLACALSCISGCGILEPKLPEAEPAIPVEWPLPPTTLAPVVPASSTAPAEGAAADIGWRDFFVDQRLEELIARALENNRDLRVAVLNVESVRAQYRIQRASRVPWVNATGTLQRSGGSARLNPAGPGAGAGLVTELYSVDLGIAGFELDLFGRVRNLSEAALQRYLAQEEVRRSAQLSLIATVANAYLTLAADQELLRVSLATLKTYEDSYALTDRRHQFGAVSGLDVHQARVEVEAARSDVAFFSGTVAQDTNALNLLIGAPVDATLLPETFDDSVTASSALPAGLPSEVLLRRPDVRQAEHVLRAANANIGAARASFFPSISLTGAIGTASTDLSDLFKGDSDTWNFTPSINLPIFQGGRLRANLDGAHAERDIALAQYERAIQGGFREVADALALTATLSAQRHAQEALVDAATSAERLSRARYEAGRDSYLVQLDAQRTLYSALQGLISTRLAEENNRVVLYQVLGGGWNERSP
ncbi:efflux transporter outer membrane subunit [Povalibacter sp.]|uniref:efflux transporter outer membrane subunit n=1 Tax=Povalibacter sp. TaxID=1962978 RepID=UPI002F41DEFF